MKLNFTEIKKESTNPAIPSLSGLNALISLIILSASLFGLKSKMEFNTQVKYFTTCPSDLTRPGCQTRSDDSLAYMNWIISAIAGIQMGDLGIIVTPVGNFIAPCEGNSNIVTFNYTGNMSGSCQATFTIPAPPIFLCPPNASTPLGQIQDDVDAAFNAWLASFSGGCPANGSNVFSNNNTGAPPNTGGSKTVTFSYSHSYAGNCPPNPALSSCQASFFVGPPPAITKCANDTTIVCIADLPSPQTGSILYTDGCGNATVSFVKDSTSVPDFVCANKQIVVRIFQAKDTCNGVAQCLQMITVKDTIAPTIVCGLPDTVDCRNDVPVPDVSSILDAQDNCESLLFNPNVQVFNISLSGANESPPTVSPGIGSGRVLVDNIAMTMRVIVDFTGLTGTTTVAHIHSATAVPLTGNAGVATTTPTFTGFPLGVTSGAYDQTFDMTLSSSYNPTFVTANGGTPATAFAALQSGMTDQKSYLNIHTSSFPGGEIRGFLIPFLAFVKDSVSASDSICINKLTIYRKYSATDECANTSYCYQTIVVNDTIAPVINGVPAKADTIACASGELPCLPVNPITATDNCTDDNYPVRIVVKRKVIDSICLNKKTILYIYTATDTCKNMSVDTFTIVVLDTIPPMFTLPGNIDTVECGQIYDLVVPVSPIMDNCDEIVFIKSHFYTIDSACPGNFKTVLEFSATDTCGNNLTLRDTIVHLDRTPPMVTCPEQMTVECSVMFPATFMTLDSFIKAGGFVTDICCVDSASLTKVKDTTAFVQGASCTFRTYEISDCCGNKDSCIQIIKSPPCVLDLALKKEIDGVTPFFAQPGGNVPFKITIYNQYATPADSIKIIDYLPSLGSTVTSPGWINNGNGTSCLYLSRANGLLPPTGLLMGDSVVIHFIVQLGLDINNGNPVNRAEISEARDLFGNILPDIDSSPDSDPTNDAGGVPNTDTDNQIDETSPVDEDDEDPAGFLICFPFVCQDQVNISLNENCEYCVSPYDVIKGILVPESFYKVEVFWSDGKKVTNACLDRSQLGYKFTYTVEADVPCINSKCWGYLTVEDKAPPMINCRDTVVTCFDIAHLPQDGYLVMDNCGNPVKVKVAEESFEDYGCNGDPLLLGVVTRRLIATDQWGNSIDCTRKLYIAKTSLDSVLCPRDTSVDCSIAIIPVTLKDKSIILVPITDPSRSHAPQVKTMDGLVDIWPNNPSCKLTVHYTDEKVTICGGGYKVRRDWLITDWCTGIEKHCYQWIVVEDKTAPIARDTTLPVVYSDPHDCGRYVDIDTLPVKDCSRVKQNYSIRYSEEGGNRIIEGVLPVKHIWLPTGVDTIRVFLVDACFNTSKAFIRIPIVDNTPPTPVCDEFTQVTVDPEGCWSAIAAKDLDNGSRDNCSSQLHFAAAKMDSIEYWRKYWQTTLEAKCGKEAYWNNITLYQSWVEDWIDCYVFADTIHFDECGSNRVVLRVYEANKIPKFDNHIFPGSEHNWYCYHTSEVYRIAHNYNYFDSKGLKLRSWRLPLDCATTLTTWLSDLRMKYISSRYSFKIAESAPPLMGVMDSINGHILYCPVDTSIKLSPGECSRILKYSIDLPVGYSAIQTAGLPSGMAFPIGTTSNSFNIMNGMMLVTTCSFKVTITEFDLSHTPSIPMDVIYTHTTYCPVDTSIDLNPGECNRIVKYSHVLPLGYSTIQTAGLLSGSSFPIGTTTNTFNIMNGMMLVTTCSFMVTINEFNMPGNEIYCNENVSVIFNNSFTILNAGNVLRDAPYRCFDNYIVEVLKNNNYVPAVFGAQDFGKTYTYRITDPYTSHKCNGQVTITSYPIYCKEDITVSLNNAGFRILQAAEVLHSAEYRCFDNYIVEFLRGNAYTPGVAGTNDVGNTYAYRVTDPYSMGTCSGKVFIDDVSGSITELNNLSSRRYLKTLYADCMVNVLVDDKQAPEIKGLEDITIYCDGAPGWADYPRACDNGYKDGQWPGYIVDGAGSKLDANGYIYGFYGGSEFLGIHPNSNDLDDPQACASAQGWAPIYCRQWLLIDSFDKAGHVNAADYFFTYKFKDKKLNQVAGKNQFTIFDNCHLDTTTLVVTNSGTINGCGEGWIARTWSIKDKCGNTTSATQKIYVKHRSDFEVLFPEDKIVTCDFINRTDTSRMGAGSPIISDNECEQVGVRYEDEIFTVEDGVYSEPGLTACYKIVRTWTLIDWCIFDPNQHNHNPDVIVNDSLRANKTNRSCVYRNIKDNNDGYMQYVQIIKVIDEIPPVVTCEDYTVCIDKDCSVLVNIPLTGTDNCADQVVFRIDITRPDNTHDIRSNVTAIAGTFTEGVYKVQIIGKDRCGNEDTCNMNLTIKDCKKPTPYCLDALATVIMPSTGTVEIWAKDFNRASTDNCTAEADLKYSFSSDETKASQVITCADMTVDGRIQLITLDVYVTDKAGNQDLCRISIQVQDNGSASQPQGACRDTSASLGNLTGILKTEELEGVEKATIQIIPMAIGTNAIPAFKSGIDGRYQFGSIAINDSYTIKAIRDDEPMNGVSTLDLVNIQKHILGIERLKSPYKMIAADVNNDNDISAIDLLELRKLILGIYDKLPDNTSWKFVPKSYVFPDINSPWSYPTEESLTHMESNMVKDFVGIKIGDVNASAFPHSLMGTEIRNTETGLIFEVEDQFFKAGEQVKVEFRSPNFAGISGFQGTINFTNDHLRFDNLSAVPSIEKSPIEKSSIVNNKINITDKNIGKRWVAEGQITMSWNSDQSIDVDAKSVLFTMVFTATKAGKLSEILRIGSQHTIAESYEGKGELGNLSIRFVKNGKEIAGTNTLYQNYPNPFDQRTVIGINLAQSTTGQLKITDVTGRTIKSIDRDWNKGYNEVWLDRQEIGATGVLYYSFESRGFNAVKKMVILE